MQTWNIWKQETYAEWDTASHEILHIDAGDVWGQFDGLVQDCSNSIANALEFLRSCAKPSKCGSHILNLYTTTWVFNRNRNIVGYIRLIIVVTVFHRQGRAVLLTNLPLNKMAAILADDIFKCIFVNENFSILIKISLKFVPKGPIDNNPALV